MRDGRPFVELHRHLDGNVRLATLLDLARRHHLPLPADSVEELAPHVRLSEPTADLMGFLRRLDLLRSVLADYDAVRRVVRENLEDAAAEGIDYIELRFSPYFMAEPHGLDPRAVAEAACDALEEAADIVPIAAQLIAIVSRTYGPERGWIEVEAAIACRERGIVALDLAGDEASFPGSLFVEHFRRAADAGLRLVAHAGEAAGADSVRQAVLELGAERIGHGIRAIDDPATVELLVERRIPLEICPTSNLHTSTVASYRDHPLAALHAAGVRVTLSTDDPAISGIDLAHEYRVARDEIGLDEKDLARIQDNALAAAFLSDEERRSLAAADAPARRPVASQRLSPGEGAPRPEGLGE